MVIKVIKKINKTFFIDILKKKYKKIRLIKKIIINSPLINIDNPETIEKK